MSFFLNYYLFNTNIGSFVISGSQKMDQSLRSKEKIQQRDIFDLFPRTSTFRKDKFPNLKEAIVVVRDHQELNYYTFKDATALVASKLYDYCVSRKYTLILVKGLRKNLMRNYMKYENFPRFQCIIEERVAYKLKNKLKKNLTNYLIYFIK